MNDFYNDYIDKKVEKVLRYLKWHPKATRAKLEKKFGLSASINMLRYLCIKNYLVCNYPDGNSTMYKPNEPQDFHADDTFWLTNKAHCFIEMRNTNSIHWLIPTIISFLALAISILSAVFQDIIKVTLV